MTKTMVVGAVLTLVIAACGSGDTAAESTTQAPATTAELTTTTTAATTQATTVATTEETSESMAEEPVGEMRTVSVQEATITVDGDPSDWSGVPALDLTLEPIRKEADEVTPIPARVQVARDAENVYVLFSVDDDYNWNPDDAHQSGAAAVMFAVNPDSGPHMGAKDEDGEVSAGMVDIWHWELECPAGTQTGGAVSGPGDGEPGNDAACNLDDEWATDAETREDDNGAGAENSLLGVWSHSAATEDADGTWYFEFSRPLTTGDEGDAQFAPGQTALMALAYWDPDFGPDGWDDDTHVQSSNQGWIAVQF